MNVTKNKTLLSKEEWIWTYKGKPGSLYNMIQFSFTFDLLSFGLLGKYVKHYEDDSNAIVYVQVTPENCSMRLGDALTDLKLQHAFQSLVAETPYRKESMFCYREVNPVRRTHGDIFWYLTHYYGLSGNYISYKCCHSNHTDHHHCKTKINQTVYAWVLVVYGALIVIFSPLFFKQFCDKLSSHNGTDRNAGYITFGREAPIHRDRTVWMYEDEEPPSVLSLFSRLLCLNNNSRLASIVRRIAFVVLSLSFIAVRTWIYYRFKRYDLQARLEADVPIGHLCIPYGQTYCYENTKKFFGGPIVYLTMYFFLGSLVLCLPKDLPSLLLSSKEFDEENQYQIWTFLFLSDSVLEHRNVISNIHREEGFVGASYKILERLYMVFSEGFWKLFSSVWIHRFMKCCFVKEGRASNLPIKIMFAFLTVASWFVLAILCLLELIMVVLYYGFPLVFTFKLTMVGYMNLVFKRVSLIVGAAESRLGQWVQLIFCSCFAVIVWVAVVFVLHMLFMQFFISFVFLGLTVLYTFLGIVAYPNTSMTFALTGSAMLFYISRAYKGVRHNWRVTLSLVVKASRQLQDTCWQPGSPDFVDDDYTPLYVLDHLGTGVVAVPSDLFSYVLEKTKPLRIQIIGAVVKLLISFNILYSAVNVLLLFDDCLDFMFQARVGAVILVCLLPGFLGFFNSSLDDKIAREKFERIVSMQVKSFWQRKMKMYGLDLLA